MAKPRVVTFTTDFGLQDAFVGIMHGVVLSINPEVTVVDICHAVGSYDLRDGAWIIGQAYRYFPPGTIHVVVVDPGVGSMRRAIVADTGDYLFVAPDNGVLSIVQAGAPKFTVHHATSVRYFLQPVSQTFHGRDVFAPIAGWLSKGVMPAEIGPEITDYVTLPLPAVERVGDRSQRGEVLRVDKFGNLITNFSEREAPELFASSPPGFTLLINEQAISHRRRSYSEGAEGELFAIVGSSGYLEIAARQASAAEKLGAAVGTPVGLILAG